MRLLLAAMSLVLTAAPAVAAHYSAFDSFTGTNTGGAFTYGVYDDTLASPTFTPFADTAGCAALISNTICTSNGFLPAAFKSTDGSHRSGTVIVPGNALILHPGASAGQSVAIEFTAPAAGTYVYDLHTFVADIHPSGTKIEEATIGRGFGTVATLTAASPRYSDSGEIGLAAGQQIALVVNYDGVYYNDSTGVNFTLSAVPEPASWALMVAGFGLVGFAARRRRVALAA